MPTNRSYATWRNIDSPFFKKTSHVNTIGSVGVRSKLIGDISWQILIDIQHLCRGFTRKVKHSYIDVPNLWIFFRAKIDQGILCVKHYTPECGTSAHFLPAHLFQSIKGIIDYRFGTVWFEAFYSVCRYGKPKQRCIGDWKKGALLSCSDRLMIRMICQGLYWHSFTSVTSSTITTVKSNFFFIGSPVVQFQLFWSVYFVFWSSTKVSFSFCTSFLTDYISSTSSYYLI